MNATASESKHRSLAGHGRSAWAAFALALWLVPLGAGAKDRQSPRSSESPALVVATAAEAEAASVRSGDPGLAPEGAEYLECQERCKTECQQSMEIDCDSLCTMQCLIEWCASQDETQDETQDGTQDDSRALLCLAWILGTAGLLGGIVGMLRRRLELIGSGETRRALRVDALLSVAQGLAAAASVPVLLSLTKSDVLSGAQEDPLAQLVLFGLGVIAAITSKWYVDRRRAMSAHGKAVELLAQATKAGSAASYLESSMGDDARTPRAPRRAPAGLEDAALAAIAGSPYTLRTLDGVARDDAMKPFADGMRRGLVNLRATLDKLTADGFLRRHDPIASHDPPRWEMTLAGKARAELSGAERW